MTESEVLRGRRKGGRYGKVEVEVELKRLRPRDCCRATMPKCPAPYDSSLSTRSLERKRRSEERRVTSSQEREASSVEGGRPSQSELASSFPSHPSCLHEPLYTQLPASSFPSPPPDVDPAILPTHGSALLEPPIASLPPSFAHLRPPSLPASLLRPTSEILDRKKHAPPSSGTFSTSNFKVTSNPSSVS